MTLTFTFWLSMHHDPYACKNQGQRSIGQKMSENRRTDTTDCNTFPADASGNTYITANNLRNICTDKYLLDNECKIMLKRRRYSD